VLPITWQTEFFEHFGTGMKPHASALLPHGERGTQIGISLSCPKGSPKSG
jgi:hypothetical protein